MRTRAWVTSGLLLLVTGCSGMVRDIRQRQSQGLTGCLEKEMTYRDLSDPRFLPGTGPWSIECHGKTFLCTANGENTAACHER